MTSESAFFADEGFAGDTTIRQSTNEGETDIKSRLWEVAFWGWCIVVVGIAIWVAGAALILFVAYGRMDEVAGVFGLYAAGAIILTVAVWAARYVATGEKKSFGEMLKLVAFGNIPLYFWFVPGVLYFGGLGTAIWNDATGDALRLEQFSEGVGGALFALLLGAPGWFFAPKKWSHIGHMAGTGIATILILASMLFLP